MLHSRHSAEFLKSVEALVKEGLSASEIGARVGVTRNAIIGVVNRNGFVLARARHQISPPGRVAEPAPKPAPVPIVVRALPLPLPTTDQPCKWPDGCAEFRRVGKPYCEHHHKIAHQPATTRGAPR